MRLPVDHFALIARWYDRWAGPPSNESLLRLLAAEPGHKLLDVGGGTGRNTVAIAASGVRVIVCDMSLGMTRLARAKDLPVTRGSATRLPFPDASMDRLLVVDAFHHFVDPSPVVAQAAAASELLRVLAPDGRLVIEEPDITVAAVRRVLWIERVLLMGSRLLSGGEMVRLFEGAGARLVSQEHDQFSVWLSFTV